MVFLDGFTDPQKWVPESSGEQNQIWLGFCVSQVEERRCMLSKHVNMFPKIGGKPRKMDGENKGKPYFLMDDLGGFPIFSETPIIWPQKRDVFGAVGLDSVRCMDTATRWATKGDKIVVGKSWVFSGFWLTLGVSEKPESKGTNFPTKAQLT